MPARSIVLTVGSPMHARAGRPPVAWWNPRLVAVLGHRPSGDREASRAQSRCQSHVGERVSRVLCANDAAKSVLYRDRGNRATLRGENAWLEEVLEWKDAMRRIDHTPWVPWHDVHFERRVAIFHAVLGSPNHADYRGPMALEPSAA